MEILGGVAFWAALGAWIWTIRPGASKHQKTSEKLDRKRKCALILLVLALILITGHLMTLSPVWNGENPEHRNQYELITEAFLEGRLDFGYEVDPVLLEMENPYDYEAREAVGAEVHFDHAFYHGKYYMYFGVVPVFLAFMPYRLVTGSALVTWQATWFFTAVYLAGLAVLFCWLAKRFVPRMTFVVLMSLLLVFSLVSTLYVTKYPSLYQTPVACGMMLEVWSLYFFSRAFYEEEKRGFRTGMAAVGSLLGALTFGCRPPLAMANLLVIPMGIHYIKNHPVTGGLIRKFIIAVIPYLVVAAGLMWYNAVRFDSPFEFGQTYQLTLADQSSYSAMFTVENLVRAPAGIFNSLFVVSPIDMLFPYLREGNGAFAVCPLLLFSLTALLPGSRKKLKKLGLGGGNTHTDFNCDADRGFTDDLEPQAA